MSDVLVRRATATDAPALAALGRAVSAEPEGWLVTRGDWRAVSDERRYLRVTRRSPHAAVFVAEIADSLVGRLSIARDSHPASPHIADLGLMVAVDQRGQGIGRALLEQAVEWAREAGVRKLELHVFPHNRPALRLYERFGFKREGYRKAHYRRGEEYLDAILMAYEIR